MINLGLLKSEFANFMVNRAISSRIADWAYWVTTDIISTNEYWWNKSTKTFVSTASQPYVILNHRCAGRNINGFFDQTNNRKLDELELERIYHMDPTPDETGTPRWYAYVGQVEVQALSTADGAVSVVSSNANDTNIPVVIRGLVGGIERIDTLNTNGTNSVSGSLTFDAGEVESVVLGSACAGYVTVTIGSDTIVTIPPGYLRVSCPKIRLFRTPSGANSYIYTFHKRAVKATNDSDIIDIPDEAFKALRYGIEEIAFFNNGDVDFSAQSYQKYNEAKEELFRWSMRSSNQVDIKGYQKSSPFEFRFPDIINHTVT